MIRFLLRLLGSGLPALLLAVVLVVVSAEVFARTLLRQPLQVAHELAVVTFAFVVWFGVVGSADSRQMFGVRVVVDRLPGRARRVAEALADACVVLIAGAVLVAAVAQVQSSQFTRFLALGWPKWIVPAGLGVAMAAVVAIHAARVVAALRAPRE